jgi:hypothetical protein
MTLRPMARLVLLPDAAPSMEERLRDRPGPRPSRLPSASLLAMAPLCGRAGRSTTLFGGLRARAVELEDPTLGTNLRSVLRTATEAPAGAASHGRHCHSTLLLAVVDCHCLGIHTVVLLSLLPFSVKITVPPTARLGGERQGLRRPGPRLRAADVLGGGGALPWDVGTCHD